MLKIVVNSWWLLVDFELVLEPWAHRCLENVAGEKLVEFGVLDARTSPTRKPIALRISPTTTTINVKKERLRVSAEEESEE